MNPPIWIQILAASCLLVAAPVYANETIARETGCLACHAVDKRVVGKAYRDVAAKYRANPFAAAIIRYKVRNGTGNNKPVPMPAFDKKALSDADLNAIIAWILKQ